MKEGTNCITFLLLAIVAFGTSWSNAQCQPDTYTNLPSAPVFPTIQYAAGSTPPLNALVTDHWSEAVTLPRPTKIVPTANPAQTNCPHLTGSFVHFHTLGFTSGQDITLPANKRVLVHSCSVGPNDVFGIVTIPATSELIFGDAEIHFQARGFDVRGKILLGSETCRLRNRITITLHGSRDEFGPLPGPETSKGLWVVEGTVEMHGVQYFPTWTRLAKTVFPGDTVIFIQDLVNWEVGQTILVSTTELKDSRDYNRNEERVIAAVYSTIHPNVAAVQVTEPFAYKHFAGRPYQAEVALLSRRLLFQGAADSEPIDGGDPVCHDTGDSTYPCNNKYRTGFGAHIRVQGSTSVGKFEGVELFRVGQTNQLGRYGIHYHMIGQNVPANRLYIKDCSVHHSFFRAYAVHGTNNVVLSQNVAYDIIGHCYFLEDGVEENNTFEYNFGALVHWLGNTQMQSTEEWFYSQGLFWVDEDPDVHILPSDSTAAVFYITNAYNRFVGNAASGGWAGFAFPNLPKPVKLHQNYKNGKFTPSARPLLLFRGNSAHSTAYWFESAGGIYVGGTLQHKPDGLLEYTAGRHDSRATCALDPSDDSVGQGGGYCNTENEVFMVFEDTKIFLANRGAQHWGDRSEVIRAELHDVGMSMNVFGTVFLTQMLVQCRSLEHMPQSTCPSGHCSPRDKSFTLYFHGFQWYDVLQNHIMTKTEFRNCNPNWAQCKEVWDPANPCNGASVFTALTHSDQFVPEVMQATKQITFTNYDPGSTLRISTPQETRQTVSGRLMNWLDMDGSIFPDAYPGQPVILGSKWANNWWKTSNACMGPTNDVWVCPKNDDTVASLFVSYDSDAENRFGGDQDCPNGGNDNSRCPVVGQVAHFGRPLAEGLLLAQNPKITGPVIKSSGGWYVSFNGGTPKTINIKHVTLHPDDSLILAFPYPTGTTFSVKALGPDWCEEGWARCTDTLVAATSLNEVRNSFGDKYFYDSASKMLYIRIVQTDELYWDDDSKDNPHEPWTKRSLSSLVHFTRDGITLMKMEAWSFRIQIKASNCGNGASADRCARVTDAQVPPAFAPSPPATSKTFAPTRVRTGTPTTLSPTSAEHAGCVKIWDQCSGGGSDNPWEKCCFSNQECVKQNEWYGQCEECLGLNEQCAGGSGAGRWTRCCQVNYACKPTANNPSVSRCAATSAPVGAPISKAPTTKQPTRTPTTGAPTKEPTTRSPTSKAPTRQPTSKAPTSKAPTRRPTSKAPVSKSPTFAPTKKPTKVPTRFPTRKPKPTKKPTPSRAPTTKRPTKTPTKFPTRKKKKKRGLMDLSLEEQDD